MVNYLETLKKVPLDSAPKIAAYGTVCKLEKRNCFFYGGWRGAAVNYAVIVNTKTKRFETLKSNTAKACAGSALKDYKVYIFGGTTVKIIQK